MFLISSVSDTKIVLQVRVVVDDAGCNGNEDINFRFTGFVLFISFCLLSCKHLRFVLLGASDFLCELRFCGNGFRFTVSGRVVGAVGGESCPLKEGGPSNVKVELLTPTGDLVSSVLTSSEGSYLFTNIIPGKEVSKLLS